MRLTNRQSAIIYNIGAILSYMSLVMLLLDAFHCAQHHQQVTFTRFGFALTWLIGALLKAPYKWDRLWLKVSALVQIVIFSIVTFLYLVGGVELPVFSRSG